MKLSTRKKEQGLDLSTHVVSLVHHVTGQSAVSGHRFQLLPYPSRCVGRDRFSGDRVTECARVDVQEQRGPEFSMEARQRGTL